MRIRFVTKAQLQVLQASKAEKHLMPDGPIPLFGSLPSAVSRQWGSYDSESYYTNITFPIAFHDGVYVVHFSDAIVSVSLNRGDVYPVAWNIGATTNSKARMLCLINSGAGKFSMIAIGK